MVMVGVGDARQRYMMGSNRGVSEAIFVPFAMGLETALRLERDEDVALVLIDWELDEEGVEMLYGSSGREVGFVVISSGLGGFFVDTRRKVGLVEDPVTITAIGGMASGGGTVESYGDVYVL
jgi:hypothetical protein